jgi:tetratricopeptide (TPR) repeat protein
MNVTFEIAYSWLNQFNPNETFLEGLAKPFLFRIENAWSNRENNRLKNIIETLLDIVDKEILIHNERAEIHVECAKYLYLIKDYSRATELLEIAIRLYQPNSHFEAVTRWLLGCVLWEIPGEKKTAFVEWERSIKGFYLQKEQDRYSLQDIRNWYSENISRMENSLFSAIENYEFGDFDEESSIQDPQPWEPKGKSEWLDRDPLRIVVPELNKHYEHDSGFVFKTWSRLHPVYRKQVWREREIVAGLYSFFSSKTYDQSIRSIGAGLVKKGGRNYIGGLLFSDDVTPTVNLTDLYKKYHLHESLSIHSEIPKISPNIYLGINAVLNSDFSGFSEIPPGKFIDNSNSPEPSLGAPTYQSGMRVFGENHKGFQKAGTLTCLAHKQSDNSPLIVGSAHVLGQKGDRVWDDSQKPKLIGRVVYSDSKNGVAIAKIDKPWSIDFRIRKINVIPGPPVFPYNGLPVQFVGASSGHQTGLVTSTNILRLDTSNIGIPPYFITNIKAKPGDSGALLISCHGVNDPYPERFAATMHPLFVKLETCAMLGILRYGPSANISDPSLHQTLFTPINEVVNNCNVVLWVREIR